MKRFRFVPFWEVTQFGFLRQAFRALKGCDEYHNKSRFLVVPLVGEFVLFNKGYDCNGPVHLSGYGPDGWDGFDSPTCSICAEIKEWA